METLVPAVLRALQAQGDLNLCILVAQALGRGRWTETPVPAVLRALQARGNLNPYKPGRPVKRPGERRKTGT